MSLLLLLSVLATSAHFTHGAHSLYPACSVNQTKTFTDNLSKASDGCTGSSSYDWAGDADPTTAQRTELCNCTVSAFDVPKCHWTKLGKYDVSTTEHFNFVYDCASTSGKTAPKVTEVGSEAVASSTESSSTTTASEASSETSPDCTVTQLNAFTGALNTASGGCTTNSTYNWGGSTDPTEAQYTEICKCAAVTVFTIPNCFVMKGQSRVSLAVHYNWVKAAQCSTFSPSQGSTSTVSSKEKSAMNVVPVFGVAGGVVVVAVMIIVAFIVYKRNRSLKEQEQQYEQQRHYQMQQPANAIRPPAPPAVGYQQKKTPDYNVHTA